MKTVELFSGTGSFSKVAAARGHNIFRVELDTDFEAEIHSDILEVQRSDLPEKIDVLWCSPPCTTFSVASIRHYWADGKPKNAKTWHGISMVLKTLELIEEIKKNNPDLVWFIENPRGMLRKQSFMASLLRRTVTYCQYGAEVMKPTDIWTNIKGWESKSCKNNASCHQAAPRGAKSGVQGINEKSFKKNKFAYLVKGGGGNSKYRSMIPGNLFEEIFDVIEGKKKKQSISEWI